MTEIAQTLFQTYMEARGGRPVKWSKLAGTSQGAAWGVIAAQVSTKMRFASGASVYACYRDKVGPYTHNGSEMKEWKFLSPAMKRGWEAVCKKVISLIDA